MTSKTALMAFTRTNSEATETAPVTEAEENTFLRRSSRFTYPTEALDTDVVGFCPTGRPISNSVLQLVEAGGPSDPAIEFTAIFYGNCKGKSRVLDAERPSSGFSAAECLRRGAMAVLTPAVLRKPPHIGGQAADVEMFTIKVGALLFSEVSLAFWTGISVT